MKPGATTSPLASMTRLPWSGSFGHSRDRIAADADVADGIQTGFRIDDPAALQDEVECIVVAHRSRKRNECGERDQQRPCCEPH